MSYCLVGRLIQREVSIFQLPAGWSVGLYVSPLRARAEACAALDVFKYDPEGLTSFGWLAAFDNVDCNRPFRPVAGGPMQPARLGHEVLMVCCGANASVRYVALTLPLWPPERRDPNDRLRICFQRSGVPSRKADDAPTDPASMAQQPDCEWPDPIPPCRRRQ